VLHLHEEISPARACLAGSVRRPFIHLPVVSHRPDRLYSGRRGIGLPGLADLAQGQTWVIELEFTPRYFIRLKPPRVYRRAPMIDALVPFREVVLRDSVPVLLKRLRFCARNGCGEAFLSRKRRLYCSRRCGQFERTARFRAKHAARITQRRRERYVAAMRRKHGPHVKVGRRSTRRRPPADPG